jgi:hypothetical protein
MSKVNDTLLHFSFVAVTHLPEDRSPDGHFAVAVCGYCALPAENAGHLAGNFPPLFLAS